MDLTWAEIAQPLMNGLAGMLGVYATESALKALRRRGISPARWARDRPK